MSLSCGSGKGSLTNPSSPADVPLGTKASNVLHYSQDKLAPVLDYFKTFVSKKKDEASDKVDEVKDKADEAASSSS